MNSESKRTGPILSQSLFTTVRAPSSSWGSHITSTILHSLLALALLLVTIPVIQHETTERRSESVTLVAPPLPEYQYQSRSIVRPRSRTTPAISKPAITSPRVLPERIQPFKPQPVPVAVKPAPSQPVVIAAAPPELKNIHPVVPPKPLSPEPAPVVPKPKVRTGSFESAEKAIGPRHPATLKVGGFGDPNSVLPSEQSHPSAVAMARLGSFDKPDGAGQSGGGGRHALTGSVSETAFDAAGGGGGGGSHAPSGEVRQTAFDTGSSGTGSAKPHASAQANSSPSSVSTGGFGRPLDTTAQIASNPHPKPVVPSPTPVEILSKPTPIYTPEARNLQVQGQVALEVVFQSDGSLRILRVLQGLGHGLDEAAKHAALQVRFRPATRGGVPIDSSATIRITFRLS